MLRVLTLLIAVTSLAAPVAAQIAAHPRVQEATTLLAKWLDAERAYKRIPGLSAAIVHDQEVVWKGASGFADVATQRPASPATLYSICSISKLFTSISVMQLRDQGKLRLDDPVEKHLPWFRLERTHPASGDITVEGLLTHASGLPREAAFPYWSGPDFRFPSREEIIAALPAQQTLYPTQSLFQYSNLGLTLAGEIVAAKSGQPYADYVRAQVLSPLGLTNTSPEMPRAEQGKRLATGYGPWPRQGERVALPFFETKGIAPAAGFASSVEDLSRFASWQFRLLADGGTKVLAANTLREMHRVHWVDPDFETTWGLGFVVWRDEGTTLVGHGGACPGYRTSLVLQPDEKIGVVVMTNAIDVNVDALSGRARGLVAAAIKAAAADSTKPKPVNPELRAYLGTYDNSWDGETQLILWEGQLAAIDLPADNPLRAITKLERIAADTFRRKRQDGKLAEAWIFDRSADGRVTALRMNYNVMRRIR